MRLDKQAGKYDLDFTPVLWAILFIGVAVGWLLFVGFPWLYNVFVG